MKTKILIILIILIGLGVGGFFVWKNFSASEEEVTVPPAVEEELEKEEKEITEEKKEETEVSLKEEAPEEKGGEEVKELTSICNKISIPNLRKYCLAVVGKNLSLCEKLETEDKNTCLAVLNQDPSFCKSIQEEEAREICYGDLAFLSGNASYCNEQENERKVSSCCFDFVSSSYFSSNFDSINTSLCGYVLEGPDRKLCYAFAEDDASYCGENRKCLAILNKDPSLCESLDIEDKDECYHDVALTSKDQSVCQKIQSLEERETCYFDFAGHVAKNVSWCDKISKKFKREQCYKSVALDIWKGLKE